MQLKDSHRNVKIEILSEFVQFLSTLEAKHEDLDISLEIEPSIQIAPAPAKPSTDHHMPTTPISAPAAHKTQNMHTIQPGTSHTTEHMDSSTVFGLQNY